jgi:hypothetical protein
MSASRVVVDDRSSDTQHASRLAATSLRNHPNAGSLDEYEQFNMAAEWPLSESCYEALRRGASPEALRARVGQY